MSESLRRAVCVASPAPAPLVAGDARPEPRERMILCASPAAGPPVASEARPEPRERKSVGVALRCASPAARGEEDPEVLRPEPSGRSEEGPAEAIAGEKASLVRCESGHQPGDWCCRRGGCRSGNRLRRTAGKGGGAALGGGVGLDAQRRPSARPFWRCGTPFLPAFEHAEGVEKLSDRPWTKASPVP